MTWSNSNSLELEGDINGRFINLLRCRLLAIAISHLPLAISPTPSFLCIVHCIPEEQSNQWGFFFY